MSAAALRETGAIGWIVQGVLARPRNLANAQLRLMAPVVGLSAFLNNTPVVAMFLPAVIDWARQNRLPVSRLLIPLSYAAILGGTCTLIGTSTNLVVNGLLVADAGLPSLGMFDITWVGLPAAAIGMVYLVFLGRWLLPDRKPVMSDLDDPREYTVEMLVETGSPLAGKTIEEALREKGGGPVKPGLPVADLTSGLWVAIVILAMLAGRERTGRGAHLDFSMLDGQVSLLTLAAARYFALGEIPPRLGTEHPGRVPSATFRCKDGRFAHITASDQIGSRCAPS